MGVGGVCLESFWEFFEEGINATCRRLSDLNRTNLSAAGMEVDLSAHGATEELMTVADSE